MANLGYLQVTRQCNQECIFCSNPPNENLLTIKDAKKALDEFKKKGFDGVILTGGEPTLYNELPILIKYCNEIKLKPRIITNGQKLSDKNYFTSLLDVGLSHIHLSIYSYKENIQSFLTENKYSLKNIIKTLKNCKHNKIAVNINTVINKYNADHLHENIQWLLVNYPFINHFVWNNLDPSMQRVEKNRDVIPSFHDFEISLHKAAEYLKQNNKTFRIERVPLCYMAEFAENSTETRKIIKNENRTIFFLDKRGKFKQDYFFYDKPEICKVCLLNNICAGVYGSNKYFSFEEIFPVFIDKENIIKRIKSDP